MGLWVTAWAAVAVAQPARPLTVVCESHGGPRPERADELLAATREGLALPGVVLGRELDALVTERLSYPAGRADQPLLALVREQVAQAQEEAARARFREAVQRLERLRGAVLQQAAAEAAEPRIRPHLHRGLVILLKGLLRLGRQGDAESLAVELDRSYPDLPVTERDHGPEAATFVKKIRAQRGAHAPLALSIESTPTGASVFLDGRYVGTTPLRLPDVQPGRYRVLAHAGEQHSRVHVVSVREESVTVRLDLPFDGALRAGGFQFQSEAERRQLEADYVLRLARALGAAEVITMGLAGTAERPLWGATVYTVESGGVLRSAAVALGPVAPPSNLLVSLGRFLRGAAPAEGLIVRDERTGRSPLVGGGAGGAPTGPERGRSRAWQVVAYVGMALGLAGVGLGAYWLAVNGRESCTLLPGQLQCPDQRHTLVPGAATLSVGGALAIGLGRAARRRPQEGARRRHGRQPAPAERGVGLVGLLMRAATIASVALATARLRALALAHPAAPLRARALALSSALAPPARSPPPAPCRRRTRSTATARRPAPTPRCRAATSVAHQCMPPDDGGTQPDGAVPDGPLPEALLPTARPRRRLRYLPGRHTHLRPRTGACRGCATHAECQARDNERPVCDAATCHPNRCGDRYIDPTKGERCDDGNPTTATAATPPAGTRGR